MHNAWVSICVYVLLEVECWDSRLASAGLSCCVRLAKWAINPPPRGVTCAKSNIGSGIKTQLLHMVRTHKSARTSRIPISQTIKNWMQIPSDTCEHYCCRSTPGVKDSEDTERGCHIHTFFIQIKSHLHFLALFSMNDPAGPCTLLKWMSIHIQLPFHQHKVL